MDDIIYGTNSGLSDSGDQYFDQNTTNVEDSGEDGDHFGAFLNSDNIDQDVDGANDCDDLVVGVPDEDLDSLNSVGAVAVFYGSTSKPSGSTDEFWHQGLSGVADSNEAGDQFGFGVWLDDHDSDGYLDLHAGSVGDDYFIVIEGSSSGLTSADSVTSDPQEGWLRNACIAACQLLWAALPPGPVCDCSACDAIAAPPSACPNCG